MTEPLYPHRPRSRPDQSYRPWGVEYQLIYDGGGVERWTQYYRTKIGAYISAWWNYYIGSWGGNISLFDNRKPCKDFNSNICVAEGCFGESCVKKGHHGHDQ